MRTKRTKREAQFVLVVKLCCACRLQDVMTWFAVWWICCKRLRTSAEDKKHLDVSNFNFKLHTKGFTRVWSANCSFLGTLIWGLEILETKSTALSAALMAWWTSRSHDPDALSFLSFLSFELFTSFYIILHLQKMTIMIIRNLSSRFHLVSSIVSSIHAFHLRVQFDDPSHFHCYERPLNMFEGGRTYSGALRRFLWRRHPHVKRHHFVMHASKEDKKPAEWSNMIGAAQWRFHMKSVGAKNFKTNVGLMNTDEESLKCAFNRPISLTCLVT